ncbi:3-hydroxyacyl-CoA dehydrogenase NAD-binding domain-containing protein [Luteimonas sp. SDU101]|uniref:3-hydroxyacyl-CoA dehydrogenase NAD-binding domain-containing protein n=1 Tax=Luteimonas sp. SDU101 TaxID=3422593 RepID=UPI003EBE3651
MINTTQAGGIAVLSIDMPGRSMNVLNAGLLAALEAEFSRALDDPQVRGIVITSAKPSFVAGADLAEIATLASPEVAEPDARAAIAAIGALLRRIELAHKPVVGATPGTALGGGLELLLATHHRIASEDAAARYGLPEVGLGLLPGAGGTQRLPRLIGVAGSLPLLLEGKPMDVAAMRRLGVFDEVVPAADLVAAARAAIDDGRVMQGRPHAALDADALQALAHQRERVLARTRGHQPAPLAILDAVERGLALPLDEGLAVELDAFMPLLRGAVSRNMLRTGFFAKQAADKLSRRPAGIAPSRVRRLGVLGAGFMGAGIAQVSALAGIDVVLVDRSAEIAAGSREAIARAWQADVDKGRLAAAARDAALARIEAGQDIDALAGCDLVIEAVAEDEAIKADVIGRTEAVLGGDGIFATNTSALPIDELARASVRPQNFIGLHFFSPVPRMALVEVIVGKHTSEQTLARALDYVRQIRKTPIVVNDGYGFYTTRCVDAYYREGIRMLADGVEPARIERAGVELGMPVGPLALADEVGIDVIQHIAHFFRAREPGPVGEDRHRPVNGIIDALVAQGRRGRKSGAGFYAYPEGAPKHLDATTLAGLVAPDATQPQPDDAQLRERLLYVQLLEAARCWAEDVIAHADEIDLGAHLGWAFPAHLGGPAAEIDAIGSQRFVARLEQLAQTLGARFTPPARLLQAAGSGFRFRP